MENAVIEKELGSTALTLKEQATAMVVKDVAGYTAAGELGKSIKDLRARIVDYFAPLKKAAHEAHKAITTKESGELKPVDEAIAILRDSMNTFSREQERLRLEAQRKAEAEAKAAADKEREKLLTQAVTAEEKGKNDKAESLLERAENVYVAPVTVAPTVAKTVATTAGNITQAREVTATVTDIKLFLAAMIQQNPAALAGIVDIKVGPLKAFVKANGLEQYPGLSIQRGTGVRF